MIVDDQVLIRKGIMAVIQKKYPNWEYLEASDGMDAFRKAQQHEPDLVMMDYIMPHLDGISSSEMILERLPDTRIIMVYAELSDEAVIKALSIGVHGFVAKQFSESELFSAIRHVMGGKHYLTGRVFDLAQVHSEMRKHNRKSGTGPFTPRETEILQLVIQGLTSVEIAQRLHISKRTVDHHRANLRSRSGTRTHGELMKYAMRPDAVMG